MLLVGEGLHVFSGATKERTTEYEQKLEDREQDTTCGRSF